MLISRHSQTLNNCVWECHVSAHQALLTSLRVELRGQSCASSFGGSRCLENGADSAGGCQEAHGNGMNSQQARSTWPAVPSRIISRGCGHSQTGWSAPAQGCGTRYRKQQGHSVKSMKSSKEREHGRTPYPAHHPKGFQLLQGWRDCCRKRYLNVIFLMELDKIWIFQVSREPCWEGQGWQSTCNRTKARLQFAEFSAFSSYLLPPSSASKPSRASSAQPWK